jgi:hypothetical protein
MEKPEENTDRRQSGDRRGHRRPRLKFFLFGGRRKSARRGGDKQEFIYVDQYRPWLMFVIILVLILSISDGLFTLHLINLGAIEKNPLMAYFLSLGAWPFMTAKFLLTCFGIVLLLIFHNFYSRILRIQIIAVIPAFVAIFLVVLFWQLFLKILTI